MEIVSRNSDAVIELHRVTEAVEDAFRACAINMLRIIAGAGKPCDMLTEMLACIEAARAYDEVAGHYPMSHAVGEMLDGGKSDREVARWVRDRGTDSSYEFAHRMDVEADIRRYALMVIAAQFAKQGTIESNVKREFHDCLVEMELLNEKRRKRYEAESSRNPRKPNRKGNGQMKEPDKPIMP